MKRYLVAALLAGATILPAKAVEPARSLEPAWADISASLYEDRSLNDGSAYIAIDSPYRTENDSRTRLGARVNAPLGTEISEVTLVLDENPMPVSAVFKFDEPLPRFFFEVTMRINGPTPLHVVAETTDGRLFVAETFVKTTGQGACAAPPGTDPEAALATLGDMNVTFGETADKGSTTLNVAGNASQPAQSTAMTRRENRVRIDVSHPSHSGMQMDQITLLFIPSRYVASLDVDLDGAGYTEMTGSISLSENPSVTISVPGRTQSVDATMTDTDGTVTHARGTAAGF